jgi:Thioredoxin
MVEFGGELDITYVMGGLAREFEDLPELVMSWLGHSAESRMPVDPRIWADGAPRSSYPACIAVKAAAEQGREAEECYLRALREGFMCERRRLDGPQALVDEARRAGLDGERFRIDLESNATLEAFGGDLEESRTLQFPALRLVGEDGERWVGGGHSYEDWRAAAVAVGATPRERPWPDVPAALRRFGRMATAELEAVCDLPGPRAGAEVWRLASDWRVKRVPVLASELWEPA